MSPNYIFDIQGYFEISVSEITKVNCGYFDNTKYTNIGINPH